MTITVDRLREVLNYDRATGVFRWRISVAQSVKAGDEAGTLSDRGYVRIQIDGVIYRAHRLAWLHVYGVWPSSRIDHRDGIGSHNWIDNLREATQAQNSKNRKVNKNNSTGHKGVTILPSGRCRSLIRCDGKNVHIGYFDTPEEASKAYQMKAKELFGDFHRPGS